MMKIFSFGGGVQSTAALVLQAQGELSYDYFVFSNVGDDSENPSAIRYLNDVAVPYAARHNIPFVILKKTTRGKPETLLEYIHRTERSVPIPVYMSSGAPGKRTCTSQFKIDVVDRWLNRRTGNATVGIGFSTDEARRANPERLKPHKSQRYKKLTKIVEYPLIDLGLSRDDCHAVILRAGLPRAPKSSCWFCPFASRQQWREMKNDNPELFEKAVALEDHINEKRQTTGRDRVYLHRKTNGEMLPLIDAVGDQMTMFADMIFDTCDDYNCTT